MYRFFISRNEISGDRIFIGPDDAHHIKDVLRMKTGDEIFVCTGDGWEYTCRISELTSECVSCEITDSQKSGRELESEITLFQCLPKGDKMETVIQKAVELGASRIVPVASSRCVVKLDAKKAESKVKRWNQISEAAAKQSKRLFVPRVDSPLGFENALKEAAKSDVCLIPYEKCEDMSVTRQIIGGITAGQSVAVLIGPEGGFSDREAEAAVKSGFKAVSLGNRILRTETAGMAALSMLVYVLDR